MSPKSQRALNLQYYEWSDFTIGTMLQVYGRTLQIYDCDESTRDFCRKHMTNVPPEKLRRMEVC